MTSGKSNIYIRLDVSIVLKKIYVLHKNFYRTQTTHEEEKINPFSIFSLLLYYCILTLLNWIELNWIDVLVANWLLKLKHKKILLFIIYSWWLLLTWDACLSFWDVSRRSKICTVPFSAGSKFLVWRRNGLDVLEKRGQLTPVSANG